MSIPDLKIGVTTEVSDTPQVTKHNEGEGEEIKDVEKRENPLYIYLASAGQLEKPETPLYVYLANAGQMQPDGRCK